MKKYKVELVIAKARIKGEVVEKKINEIAQAGWELEHVTHLIVGGQEKIFLYFAHED